MTARPLTIVLNTRSTGLIEINNLLSHPTLALAAFLLLDSRNQLVLVAALLQNAEGLVEWGSLLSAHGIGEDDEKLKKVFNQMILSNQNKFNDVNLD